MRLSLLSLVLGLVVGFALHSLVTTHPHWYRVFTTAPKPPAKVVQIPSSSSAEPIKYPSSEKTLARLQKLFDEAVVVVLADESYDDNRKVVLVTVREVWKGPQSLVGQTMNSDLRAPLSYLHNQGTQRVLRFMPMTPHLDTNSTFSFKGHVLKSNPAFTVESLKEALLSRRLAQM